MAILMAAVFILPMVGVIISPSEDIDAASKGVIVVETSPDFAPYDYYYGTEFVGIDMDILRAIGMDTGYSIQFKQNRFDSIITSVTAGNCDMGASGFTITDERKKSVNFTQPYTTIKQVAVGLKSASISGESDLAGKNLVAQLGTSGEYYVQKEMKVNYESYTGLNTYSDIVLGLLNGAYDYEIVDEPVGLAQVTANPELAVYPVLNAPIEEYGFLFNKNDTALLDEINNSLTRLKADGTIDAILKYYSDNGYRTDTPSYYDQEPTLFVISDNIAPYSYNRLGDTVGIDADIMRAIGDKIGYKVRFIDVRATEIIDKILWSPNYIGAGSLEIRKILNEKNEEDVVFSDAYATDKLVIVSPNGSTITTADNLSGMHVGVVTASKAKTYVEDKDGIADEYSTVSLALDAVNRGELDCAVVDYATAKSLSYGFASALVIHDTLTDAPVANYGFMFSAGATELIELVNGAIADLTTDGTIDEVKTYYADRSYNPDTPSFFDDTDDSFWGKIWDRIERCFLENDRWELYFDGLKNTLKITVVALLIGLVIGVLLASAVSLNAQTGKLRIISALCKGYITIIRGTPVMIQLLIIYYVVFASSSLNAVLVASIAFGINSGAYIAEIVRSGMNSVNKGQTEAARCLGLNNGQAMKSVVVPQAIRNIMPALGNESIALLKETSIAGFIGVLDLTRAGDIIRGQTYDALVPLIAVALIYLVIVLILQFLVKKMERRLNNAY